jgi:hypothetical protein
MQYIDKPSYTYNQESFNIKKKILNVKNIPVILLPNIETFEFEKTTLGPFFTTYLERVPLDPNLTVIENIKIFNSGINLITNILTLGRKLENTNDTLELSSFEINTKYFAIESYHKYQGSNNDMGGQSETARMYDQYEYKVDTSNKGWKITTTPNLICDVHINHDSQTPEYVSNFLSMIDDLEQVHDEDDYYNFFINLLNSQNKFRIIYYIQDGPNKLLLFLIEKKRGKNNIYNIYIDPDFFKKEHNKLLDLIGLGPDTKPAAGLPPIKKALFFKNHEQAPVSEPVSVAVPEPVSVAVPEAVPEPVSRKSLFSRLGRTIAKPFKKLTRKSSRKGSSRKGSSRKGSYKRLSSRKSSSSNV